MTRRATLEGKRMAMRVKVLGLVAFAIALSTAGCAPPAAQQGGAPYPPVASVPKTPLPSWIVEISPTGTARPGAQIRVRFKNDVIPLDSLESPERQGALAHFTMVPALPGHFIFLTPRMAGFEADAPLQIATRVRVTLTAGLADLKGNRLDHDYIWTFASTPIALSALSGSGVRDADLDAVGRRPTFSLDSNTTLDEASLAAHITLLDTKHPTNKPVGVEIVHDASPSPAAEEGTGPNPGDTTRAYALRPVSELAGDTIYAIAAAPGIAPAQGNMPSSAAYRGKLRTYGPLAFLGTATSGRPNEGGNGRFAGGSPMLNFSNGLDAASARAAVTIAPSPNPGIPLAGVEDGSATIAINPFALNPRTTYTLTVAGTLKDQFGQRLGQTATGTFTTSDFIGNLWAPTGFNIFPAATNIQLNVETTNLPEGRYQSAFRTVAPEELIDNDPNGLNALPPPSGWPSVNAPKGMNQTIDTAIPLRQKLGGATGMLAYGFMAKTYQYRLDSGKTAWQMPQYQGIVQLTDIGIFAQWFPGGGIVRTAHLSDGRPIPSAQIDIFPSQLYSTAPAQASSHIACASGTTDAGGTWTLDSAAFARCASTAHDGQTAPELLVVAHDGADWAFVRTLDYSGFQAPVNVGWSAGVPDPHGAIVSDRTLYQPGETAEFAALAYFDENGTLVRGRSSSYAVSVENPSGRSTSLGNKTLDAFGSFTVAFPIDKHADVGYYTISAKAANGEALSGSFRVAQFKPPNFKVELSLNATTIHAGASVAATTKSTYLFGAPVEGGKSHYYVTRAQSTYVPAGWQDFDFGRSWFYPEEPPSVAGDVLQKDVTTAADGGSAVTVPVASDLPFAMDYRVDSETTDVSNLSVADSKTFTAFPGDAMIGERGGFVATAGTPFDIDVVALDLNGKPVAGKSLKLVLQQRNFNSVTQISAGSETPLNSIHYTDAQTVTVSSGTSPQKATFTAPKAGSYRIRANFDGAPSDATATDHDIWISGPGAIDWGNDPNAVTVKLNKATYRLGETATALVQSPYADADLFFAVVRHGVIYKSTSSVHGPAPQVHFVVTADMLPNAAVEAVLVRRGTSLGRGVPAGLGKLARTGFAPFEVALDDKYLKVGLTAANASAQPGTRQHLTIKLTDKRGRPVAGELALAVVNDAVLQLSGYRFPDLVKIVYADQPISTRFADNRTLVTLATMHQYVDKGFGFGGGAMAGPAGTRVRTNFQPLAYWNGALRTDAAGNASVDFQLPDDLTTWRVLAMAMTSDARFGNGDSSFIATKPLVTNPIVPQFARPGDTFSLGVSVTNVANATGQASIAATLQGPLTFADSTQQKTLQSSLQGLTSAYRFDVVASGAPGPPVDANLKFVTHVGANADAFAVPLQVRTNDVLETVATSGATSTDASVPLDIPRSPIGEVDVTLANTLLAELSEPRQLVIADRPPFAVALASRIAVAADTLVLERQAGHTGGPSLRSTAAADLDALEAQALPDGGYAPWPGAHRSDIWSTAFIATQLQQARMAGLEPRGIAHVERFLASVLADPSVGCATNDQVCYAETRLEALETLVTLGQVRSDFLSDIWTQHQHFAYVEQVELARTLLKIPGWRDQGIGLRDSLLQQVYETARHAAVNTPSGFETDVAQQAQMLGLVLDSAMPVERADKMVTSLLAARGRDGTWACLCDDAEAMNALVAYAQGAGKPATFDVVAALGSTTHNASLTSSVREDSFSIPLGGKAPPAGKMPLTLTKKGAGILHYLIALRYRAPDVSPGVYSGIRIDRRLHPVNDPSVLASFGLAPVAATATIVAANRVFEIEDRITTDHPLDHVVVIDPLPAGFEAVDSGFRTATPYFQAHADDWQIDYQAIYKDRVLSFAHYLPAGVYAVHYLVRSVTPGSFDWPGAQVSLQFAPEEFGRTAATRLTITP
jgi:uncharacterized protein YfaS (alpha-2-macroglobulin family)